MLEHPGMGQDPSDRPLQLPISCQHPFIAVSINGCLGCAYTPQVVGDSLFYLIFYSVLGYLCLLGVLFYKGPRLCFLVIFTPTFSFIWALSKLY